MIESQQLFLMSPVIAHEDVGLLIEITEKLGKVFGRVKDRYTETLSVEAVFGKQEDSQY